MSTIRTSPPYTPRTNPGSVPTADITQYYLDDDLTKLAGFITSVPPDLLYNIMSAATEADLRALLALIDPSDLRIEPGYLMTRTSPKAWADIMGRQYADLQGAEIAFLKDLDFRTWVHEADFKEFVGRFEIVWEMLLENQDDVFF
ncbi:hypothetical protein J4E90_011055 [Alternaria incomplexa]|uniref:uncharacterized protein n=1 Tax=Alternaria incomplexa TaxID=1187928 RepID=UPI00221F8D35|nr:uncharacterized protein J4E90_011055 [Alternaria incomplexa]KAI4905938.1 hypothetical protein J4E90_011055 [Alternaria incomplexa]